MWLLLFGCAPGDERVRSFRLRGMGLGKYEREGKVKAAREKCIILRGRATRTTACIMCLYVQEKARCCRRRHRRL